MHDDAHMITIRELEDAKARIEELEAAQEWQPIETAPKDGTMVFVWWPDAERFGKASSETRIKLGRFLHIIQAWSLGGVKERSPVVTHWRPFFDTPKGTDDDG